MPPQKYTVKVLEKVNFSRSFWWLKIEKPVGFEYLAGQYISVLVGKQQGLRRSYSLASWPRIASHGVNQEPDYLELSVDVAPMGVGSKFILELKVGEEIEILGPLGQFIAKSTGKPKAYLGTGCGVVPLRSMIHDLLENRKFTGKVGLHWGMRYKEDAFWREEFEELERKYPNFSFDLILSKPDSEWKGCVGHVQDCLVKHNPDLTGWEAYLCGNSEMVEDMASRLVEKGIKKEEVYRERFN